MSSPLGIILAAGRGSRMGAMTGDQPKCMTRLAGKTLLSWQIEALRAAGVDDLLVVGGYLSDRLRGDFTVIRNERWSQTNMVASLLCALPQVGDRDCLVSYSDIVYSPAYVEALRATCGDIVISYDLLWEELWRLRFGNPLLDAETFEEREGVLLRIGDRPSSLSEVKGQYMGLVKLTPHGWNTIGRFTQALPAERLDKLDMTGLLKHLLADGITIRALAGRGGWCEVDTQTDLEAYEKALEAKTFSHDWRAKPQGSF